METTQKEKPGETLGKDSHKDISSEHSPASRMDAEPLSAPRKTLPWDEWFQLIVIIAIIFLLLFPLWWVLFDIF